MEVDYWHHWAYSRSLADAKLRCLWMADFIVDKALCVNNTSFSRGDMRYTLDFEIGIIIQLVMFYLIENNMSYFLVRKKNPHVWLQGHCSCTILIDIIQNRGHLSSVSVHLSWFMQCHVGISKDVVEHELCSVKYLLGPVCSPYPISTMRSLWMFMKES